MLIALLNILDTATYAPSTRQRYASHLGHFARWCSAQGVTRWPVEIPLLARYIRAIAGADRRRVAALDSIFRASGRGHLRDKAVLAEALVAASFITVRPTPKPIKLRDALHLSRCSQRTYADRIRRFAGWCTHKKLSPSWSTAELFLQEQDLQPRSRQQYRAAFKQWAQMPAMPVQAAERPTPVPKQPSKPDSAAQPAPRAPRGRRRSFTLRTSEQRLLYQLGRTGIAEHHRHARQFARVDEKRLRRLVRLGYLEVHHGDVQLRRPNRQTLRVRYYSLGHKGRRWLHQHGVRHLYRWNPRQVNHDLHLTDVYYQLPPAVRSTWMTESELIERLQRHGRHVPGSAVDGVVFFDGQAHGVEIAIGYKRVDVEKKRAFIQAAFGGRGILIT